MRWLMAILVGLAASACGGDPGDALVVVQETNVPDPPPPCDGYANAYVVDYVRECDQSGMQVNVSCRIKPPSVSRVASSAAIAPPSDSPSAMMLVAANPFCPSHRCAACASR